MKNRYLLLIILFAAAVLLAGCGAPAGNTGNASNTAAANSNANGAEKPASNNPLAVTTPTPDQVTNNAPTLTPVYKAYCAAFVKKDEAALRKFYTSDTLADFEKSMKEDNVKTLTDFLKGDKISNELCEVANERINGDKAIAKVRTAAYPNGYDVLFVKENGEWKMSNMDPKKGF